MYENTLSKAGLTSEQAVIYEALIKIGPLPAGEVSKRTGLKRGLTYKILDELTFLGLVNKNTKNKILHFEPAHPLRLKELAESKEKEAKVAQEALGGIMGNLTSDFNLISGKPGVRYYEGKEAVRVTATDAFSCAKEIYEYLDLEALLRYIPLENKQHVAEIRRLGIRKKIICPDTEFVRAELKKRDGGIAEYRLIPSEKPFATVMQIYCDTVSYLTLDEKVRVAVLIDNPFIANMHKELFVQLWEKATPVVLGA